MRWQDRVDGELEFLGLRRAQIESDDGETMIAVGRVEGLGRCRVTLRGGSSVIEPLPDGDGGGLSVSEEDIPSGSEMDARVDEWRGSRLSRAAAYRALARGALDALE